MKSFDLFFKRIFNLLSINLGIDSNPLISVPVTSYRENPPECIILDNWVLEIFILADEPFTKVLGMFETCVLVNDNLCGKLFLSVKFDEIFKVNSVPRFCRF